MFPITLEFEKFSFQIDGHTTILLHEYIQLSLENTSATTFMEVVLKLD
jgi:hypothetical protein